MALKNPAWKITVYDSGPFTVDVTEREMEFLIRGRRFWWTGRLESNDIQACREDLPYTQMNENFVIKAFLEFYAFAAAEKLFESI